MKHITPATFTGNRAWQALDIANLDGTSVRLHWTDQPYQWHVNDGQEVFVVLSGTVTMFYKDDKQQEQRLHLATGDIFYAQEGCEHVAHPEGEARILVIERAGSV